MSTATVPTTANKAAPPAQKPARPIDTLRDLLEKSKGQLEMALPSHLTPERMIRVALTAVQRQQALLDCSPVSIVSCVMQAAELGLELTGPLGHCYMVPRWNGKTKCKDATFQVGYRGLIALAFRSGMVSHFNAHEVCANDSFAFAYGTDQYVKHVPSMEDRGPVIAYYATFRTKDGASDFEVMSRKDVEAHRDRYSKKPQFGEWVWETAFDEMAKKTVIRRLAKRAPLSSELIQAAVSDEYGEAAIGAGGRPEQTINGPPVGRISLRPPAAAQTPDVENQDQGGDGFAPSDQPADDGELSPEEIAVIQAVEDMNETIGLAETAKDLEKVGKTLATWESRLSPEQHAAVRDALAAKQQQIKQAR